MVAALLVALAFQPAPAMLRGLFEDALARRVAEYGEADARTAQAARDLGLFLVRQGDPVEARVALEKAVRADERTIGPWAPQTLADLADLASVTPAPESAGLWQRASASPDAAVASRSLAALGDLQERAGDHASARDFYRWALEKEEAATGRNSVRVAARLNTLALVVEPEEAVPLLERALRISTAAVGIKRLETASIQMNLAARLLDVGRTDRALQLASQAASSLEDMLGRDHPRTAASRLLRDRATGIKAGGKK